MEHVFQYDNFIQTFPEWKGLTEGQILPFFDVAKNFVYAFDNKIISGNTLQYALNLICAHILQIKKNTTDAITTSLASWPGPESGPESKPESKPESGPESKPESGSESGSGSESESKPESGSESGSESKPESGSGSKFESESMGANSASGVLTSANEGSVSVSFAPPPSRSAWQYWLNQTPYGQQFLALFSSLVLGGFYIGGLPESQAFRKTGGAWR